jgi:hypothetical protein
MQGNAFLGFHKSEEPEYAYMFRGRMDERYDLCRAVRDKQFRYIRNFMPYRIYGQNLYYLWLAPSARAWEKAYLDGNCNDIQSIFWNTKPAEELYDSENDPWEVNNLATNPAYKNVLERMRSANRDWMIKIKDSGLIPEAQLSDLNGGTATYDYLRSDKLPLQSILEAAEKATNPGSGDLVVFKSYLKSDLGPVRYWGATGLMMLGSPAAELIPDLKNLLNDPSADVIAAASEALFELGDIVSCNVGLSKVLQSENPFARLHALNIIESRKINTSEIQNAVIAMAEKAGKLTLDNYDHRAAKRLLDVWTINPRQHNIEITW